MARKKQTYEEQRMDELLYAEEYRRRLRMEREAENTEVIADTAPAIDIEADDGEPEYVRRDRDERKKRNDDILSRVSKIYTIPAESTEDVKVSEEDKFAFINRKGNIEVSDEKDIERDEPLSDWTPITKEPDAVSQHRVKIQMDESSVSHTLHIEGVSISGVSAEYTSHSDAQGMDIEYVGIERRRRGENVLHTSESFEKYAYQNEDKNVEHREASIPTAPDESYTSQSDMADGIIFGEGYADSSALDDMQSFIYAPLTRADHAIDRNVSEVAYTENNTGFNTGGVVYNDDELGAYRYSSDNKDNISDGTEEDDLLSFLKYTENRNREIKNGERISYDGIYDTHITRDTVAGGYSEADINGVSRMSKNEEKDNRMAGSAAERREIEADMERFLKEDAEYKKNSQNNKKTSPTSNQPTTQPFDKNTLKRVEKVESDRDIAYIESWISSRIDTLEKEKDAAELTFTKSTSKDQKANAKRDRDIKDTKRKLRDAVYLERQDNKRYYSFVLMDIINERLPKNADLKLLISLREKLISLLHQRDTVNKRLTELYLGDANGRKSVNRERDRAVRAAMRTEFKRQKSLDNKIKNAHVEKMLADMLRELMDKQVLLAGELAECRYILRHERPKGQAAKDVKEREKRANAEYKKNKRELDRISKTAFKKAKNRKHKNNSAVLGWIGLLALIIIGVAVWLGWDALVESVLNIIMPSA